MSTDLVCFLFGIPAVVFWSLAFRRGAMLFGSRIVTREIDPVPFWISSAFLATIAFGLLIAPILRWTGLRE